MGVFSLIYPLALPRNVTLGMTVQCLKHTAYKRNHELLQTVCNVKDLAVIGNGSIDFVMSFLFLLDFEMVKIGFLNTASLCKTRNSLFIGKISRARSEILFSSDLAHPNDYADDLIIEWPGRSSLLKAIVAGQRRPATLENTSTRAERIGRLRILSPFHNNKSHFSTFSNDGTVISHENKLLIQPVEKNPSAPHNKLGAFPKVSCVSSLGLEKEYRHAIPVSMSRMMEN
ncbi:uncharacterized protein LOC135162639 [Diachasmimorpha longicaudata]|uniref:uncharacterized protein LOC135162639 n=1 Tax=Diachasmimorpha longicaudata TaxID=58733 RepID=UPI0030B893F8